MPSSFLNFWTSLPEPWAAAARVLLAVGVPLVWAAIVEVVATMVRRRRESRP